MDDEIDKLLSEINTCRNEARLASKEALLEEKLVLESKEKLAERIKKSSNPLEIETAKFALWRKELDTSFEGLLDVINSSAENLKVRHAACLLGEKGYKNAVEPLIKLLCETESEQIRNGAAFGLHELADQRALEPLVATIKKNTDTNISSLFYALESMDCHGIIEFLVDYYVSHPEALMSRYSILECIRTTNKALVPSEVLKKCRQKIREAIVVATDEQNREQLNWLGDEVIAIDGFEDSGRFEEM